MLYESLEKLILQEPPAPSLLGIGVAVTSTVGYNGVELLAAADEAMYEVKRARQSRCVSPEPVHRSQTSPVL